MTTSTTTTTTICLSYNGLLVGLDIQMDTGLHFLIENNESLLICSKDYFQCYIVDGILYITAFDYDPKLLTRRKIYSDKSLIWNHDLHQVIHHLVQDDDQSIKERISSYELNMALKRQVDYACSWSIKVTNNKNFPLFDYISINGALPTLTLPKEIISIQNLTLLLTGSCAFKIPTLLTRIKKCNVICYGQNNDTLLPCIDFQENKISIAQFHIVGSGIIIGFSIRKQLTILKNDNCQMDGYISGIIKNSDVYPEYKTGNENRLQLSVKKQTETDIIGNKKKIKTIKSIKKTDISNKINENTTNDRSLVDQEIIQNAIDTNQILYEVEANVKVLDSLKIQSSKIVTILLPEGFCPQDKCRKLCCAYNQKIPEDKNDQQIFHCESVNCHIFSLNLMMKKCEDCAKKMCRLCYTKSCVPESLHEELDYEYTLCIQCRLKDVESFQEEVESELKDHNNQLDVKLKNLEQQMVKLKTEHKLKTDLLQSYLQYLHCFQMVLRDGFYLDVRSKNLCVKFKDLANESKSSSHIIPTITSTTVNNTTYNNLEILPKFNQLRTKVQANWNRSKRGTKNACKSKPKTQTKFLSGSETTSCKISKASNNNA